MSDEVVFQEESANTVSNIGIVRGAPKGLLAWMIKQNLAKDGKEAERFLLILAIVMILIALGIAVVTFVPRHATAPATVPGSNGQLVPLIHP